MPAKFTIRKDKAGTFRFTLSAPNGQVVATSKVYASKAAAQSGITSIRTNAAAATVDDTTMAAAKTTAKTTATTPQN